MKKHHKALINLIRDYVGTPNAGAEVGVFRGETVTALHSVFPNCYLYLVDPWKAWEEGTSYHDNHRKSGKFTRGEWNEIYEEVVIRVEQSPGLSKILRMLSEEAVSHVEDGSLDFVFLDGNHVYDHVKKDIELWLPKLKKGGLMSGHDYKGVSDRKGGWGVSRAVHEIFGEQNVLVCGGRIWGIENAGNY